MNRHFPISHTAKSFLWRTCDTFPNIIVRNRAESCPCFFLRCHRRNGWTQRSLTFNQLWGSGSFCLRCCFSVYKNVFFVTFGALLHGAYSSVGFRPFLCAASDWLFGRRFRLRMLNTYFRVGFCTRRMCANMSSWEKNVDEALYGCDFSRLELLVAVWLSVALTIYPNFTLAYSKVSV